MHKYCDEHKTFVTIIIKNFGIEIVRYNKGCGMPYIKNNKLITCAVLY